MTGIVVALGIELGAGVNDDCGEPDGIKVLALPVDLDFSRNRN